MSTIRQKKFKLLARVKTNKLGCLYIKSQKQCEINHVDVSVFFVQKSVEGIILFFSVD